MTDASASDPIEITCAQRVFAEDDCCTEGTCTEPAAWLHVDTGLALCERHEANARRYGDGEEWMVGTTKVSFPAGWERLEARSQATTPALEVVREGSGLVTWDGPVSGA